MASSNKKSSNDALPAEISLQQLRSCLVNLPAPLVNLLVEANVVRTLEQQSHKFKH